MKIVILGGGKIGYYLTKSLLEQDYSVSIIELDKERSQVLANDLLGASVIHGNGTTVKTLEQAGIKNCDAIIAVSGRDEDNLIACQLAKRLFNVRKTIAKVNNPKNVAAMKCFEIDIAVIAAEDIIHKMQNEVSNSSIKELIHLNDGKAALIEIQLPENYSLANKQISEITLPDNCSIISITRRDEFIFPRGKTRLFDHDKLLIATDLGVINDVRKAFKVKK